MITQKRLKELLHYDPETGNFTWIVRRQGAKVDRVAGYLDIITGYRVIRLEYALYKAHRLAWLYMTGEWPKDQIDHDDHVRDNNKWDNLNQATNQENGKNQSKSKNNTSGITGVSWHKQAGRWRSRIMLNRKEKYLGLFIDKFEAICSRMSANNKYGFHINHGNDKKLLEWKG